MRKMESDLSFIKKISGVIVLASFTLLILGGLFALAMFRINVPLNHYCVLLKKFGKDLEVNQIIGPDSSYKGIQKEILYQGVYYYNPWYWKSEVRPMLVIPDDKLGVRVRLYGDDLEYDEFIATKDNQKGIVAEPLLTGRHPINAVLSTELSNPRLQKDYLEIVYLFDPVRIPAGFIGIVTNLHGPIQENPNTILSEPGFKGTQKEVYDAGKYFINPYTTRINVVDATSQKVNIASGEDMGFPSKDGFGVTLGGSVEFRIMKDRAAELYVLHNEAENDKDGQDNITEEIVRKILMQAIKSYCRLNGSNTTGREFIGGETRAAFGQNFKLAMKRTCEPLGIEIIEALISDIKPPQEIAGPVRDREIARQLAFQYEEQVQQQFEEAKLAKEKGLIQRAVKLVEIDQEITKLKTQAEQDQKTKITKANEEQSVANKDLEAAIDQAKSIEYQKDAEAALINLRNLTEAAGWKSSTAALDGGQSFADLTMFQKLAPSFKRIMSNTADSPFIEIFKKFTENKNVKKNEDKKVKE